MKAVGIQSAHFSNVCLYLVGIRCVVRPGGRGSSRGFVRSNPLLTSTKFLCTALNFLSVLPFESGPLGLLLLRITAFQMSLRCSHFCDKMTCISACVDKSQVQALETTLDLVPSLVEFRHQQAQQMRSYMVRQKLDAILCESCTCSYYGSASIPKWPQKISALA